MIGINLTIEYNITVDNIEVVQMKNDSTIAEKLVELVLRSNPDTVEALVKMAEEELGLPQEELLMHVLELEKEGGLELSRSPDVFAGSFIQYVFSPHALWFWIVLALSVGTTYSAYFIPETAVPFVYIRYVLGTIFVVFLPGFSLVTALFPTREIDSIERLALNIGMSLALVPLVGLLLNYTPWGVRLIPIITSLLALTITLSIVGLVRKYYVDRNRKVDTGSS